MTLNRDSDFAKQTLEAFKALENKYSKRISVVSQNSKLTEEHLLPMLVAQDRSSGDVVAQIFNFVDLFPSKQQMTPESNHDSIKWLIDVERMLMVRGILEPIQGASKQFETKKEESDHMFAVGSSYLQDSLDNNEVEALNRYIQETEKIIEVDLDPRTINYIDSLITNYREVEDPFKIEIAEISYEQNPGDANALLRNLVMKQ